MKQLREGLMIVWTVWTLSFVSIVSLAMIFGPMNTLLLPRVGIWLIITTFVWTGLVFWHFAERDFSKNKVDNDEK